MRCLFETIISPLSIGLLSVACTLGASAKNSEAPMDLAVQTDKNAPARPSWDAWLKAWSIRETKENPTQVFALLTSGGFAGAGKGHWILLLPKSKKPVLVYVEPSLDIPSVSDNPKLSRSTPETKIVDRFLEQSKQFPDSKFEPEHPAVDGWRYAYYQFEIQGEKLQKLVHFDMDSPYFGKESSKGHQLLINSFEELLEKKP